MAKITLTQNTDKASLLTQAATAVTRLNEIIAGVDGMTTAQLKTALKDIAKYERALIKRVVQLI